MDTRERVAGELSRWVHLLFGGRAPEKVVFDVEAGRLCAIFAEERAALVEKVKQLRVSVEAQADALVVVKRREAKLMAAAQDAISELDDIKWPDGDECQKDCRVCRAIEHLRTALATAPVSWEVKITLINPPAEGFSGGHDEPSTPRDAAKEQTP